MERLYKRLAGLVMAMNNCKKSNNTEWFDKHEAMVLQLVRKHMPSGGGFDSGTTFDIDSSTSEKLIFHTSYHHMDDNGSYSGWTHHIVVVKPSLFFDFDIQVSGQNRDDIKSVIQDTFDTALMTEVD